MKNLIPHFIQEKFRAGIMQGQLNAYVMFVDLSGFTPMTESMMKRGNEGVELLSQLLNQIFSPLVHLVYQRGGFIPYFAGDSFTAIFPSDSPDTNIHEIIEAARLAADFFTKEDAFFYDFEIGIKVGLSFGNISWGIVGKSTHSFYFRGEGIDKAAKAQTKATQGQIIIDKSFKAILETPLADTPISSDLFLLDDCRPRISENQKSTSALTNLLSRSVAANFLPESVLDYQPAGEFRTVVSVFIAFANINSHDVMDAFATIVLEQMQNTAGYFKEIDFGDKGGLMVGFYGAPVSFENNTERALEFVTAISEQLKPLQAQSGCTFRVGMTQGTAYTGMIGGVERCQYAVVGARVNLAARIMSKAAWGEVMTDDEIQANRFFRFKYQGNILYKGFENEISTYQLIGRNVQDIPSFKGNLIGREEELELIENFALPIFEGHAAGITTIFGEAGIGKSRLTYELRSRLKKKADFNWYSCQADQILKKPFNPFIYFLKTYFQQSPDNTDVENKSSFDKNFDWLLTDLRHSSAEETSRLIKDLIRIKSVLAGLIGFEEKGSLWEKLNAKGRYDNVITALSAVFQAEALLKPLILELEDAHWFDDSSKDFLARFLAPAKHYPILFLITSRYTDDGRKPYIIKQQALTNSGMSYLEVDLNILKPKSLKAFAESALGGPISKDLRQVLMRMTNGNPFYLEQVIEYFKENKLIEYENRNWHIKEKNIKISGSINAILTARIDRLSKMVQETVKAAAVIGREFDLPVLSEIMKSQKHLSVTIGDEINSNLKEQIDLAERGQIWRARNELRYIFSHALLREAVYDMQLRTRLRELHQLIAEAIEKLYAERLEQRYVDLAFHYEQAGIEEKTNFYLLKAADRVRRNFQNQLAIEYYDKLLANLVRQDAPAQRASVLLKKAKILQLIGKWETCEGTLRKAQRLAQGLGDDMLMGRIHNQLGHLLMLQGAHVEARRQLEIAAAHFEKIQDKKGLSKVYSDLGNLYLRQSKYEEAKNHFSHSIELADLYTDAKFHAHTIANFGLVHMNLGNYDEGIRLQKEQLEICQKVDDEEGSATLYTNMGIVYLEKGDYPKALDCFNNGLKLSEDLGNKQLTSIAVGCIGSVYQKQGDYKKALTNFELDLKICEELGDKQGIAIALELMGELYNEKGEFKLAIAYLQKALMLSEELHYVKGTAKALNTLGDVYYLLKNYEHSIYYYDRAIALTRQIGNRLVLGMSLIEKGRSLIKIGNAALAEQLNYEASQIAHDIDNKELKIQSKILAARLKESAGSIDQAERILQNLLTEHTSKDKQASLYFHLYEITNHPKYRDLAIRLYKELQKTTSKYAYKVRLQKLN